MFMAVSCFKVEGCGQPTTRTLWVPPHHVQELL